MEEERERSTRQRGVLNAEQLKVAQRKSRKFDESAATEWLRLKKANLSKPLTPEIDPVNHAQCRWDNWDYLSDLRQKKG